MEKKYDILITGVAGLIGARLADWIIENYPEYTVIGIDSMFGGYIENINPKVKFYKRDLATDDIKDIFEKYSIGYVFHFAAYAAEGLSPFMRMFTYKNNTVATANIINNCINFGVNRLVYTSSMSVYGRGIVEGERFDEDDTPNPIDPYAVSKYGCEMDIKIAGEQHGMDWCIIRPHNVYGEKQNIWDSYRNVLGIWMFNSTNNNPILIYGDGEQTRAFTYIGDILEPLWNAGFYEEASKQIINLGSTEESTLNEVAKIVADITSNHNIQYKEARYEVKKSIPTFEKSIKILGFKQKTSLKDGLLKMWNWVLEQPKREKQKFDNFELNKGIYSYWK